MTFFNEKNPKENNTSYYSYSNLAICGRASELASQAVSHFLRFSDQHIPYCVFCLASIEDINKNKVRKYHSHYDTISLEGARIG